MFRLIKLFSVAVWACLLCTNFASAQFLGSDAFDALVDDPATLLAVSFSGEITDESESERSLSVSNYELGPDRFGNANSALHPIGSMPQLIQGSCNDFVNGNEANNFLSCASVAAAVTIVPHRTVLIREQDTPQVQIAICMKVTFGFKVSNTTQPPWK